MSAAKSVVVAVGISTVGYLAALAVILRLIADAVDVAVRIDGGLHR